MKINVQILIAVLAISSSCFSSVLDLIVPMSYAAVQDYPGYCPSHSPAGDEMNQGVNGYERQVKRELEPATEDDATVLVEKAH